MAILGKCLHCNKEVAHSASELPLCDDHNGKNEARAKEVARWAALTPDQKLDELKARLDAIESRSRYWDYNVPIG